MTNPKPAGHYSPYIKTGNFIFTSGQLPIVDPVTKEVPLDIKEQTRIVLKKVVDLIKQEGCSKKHIVKTTAYISNIDDWPAVNEVYVEFFGEHKPARSIIPVSNLHYGCKIELEAIATCSD
jgi:2-iminobutanoate/2-iminopropanoate deaminase